MFLPLCQGNFLNFEDFFADFDLEKALRMLRELEIDVTRKIKALSKGTKEKLALIQWRHGEACDCHQEDRGGPSSVRVLGCWSVGYECVYIHFFS